MRRATQRIVLVSGAALAAVVAGPGSDALPGRLVPAAWAKDKDLVGDFERQWERNLKDSAKEYEKLYKWCLDNALEATGIRSRRRVLRYLPDDAEVREYLGYVRDDSGAGWRSDEARRDNLRTKVDIDDPKAAGYPKRLADTEKRIARDFRGLAKKAEKNAAEDPANASLWKEKAAEAWERVLQVDRENEEAHKALDHPKYEGKYVSPFALKYLEVRSARKRAAEKASNDKYETKSVPMDGAITGAAIEGAGAQSQHFRIDTSHGDEVAKRLAQRAEQTISHYIEIYGVNESLKERVPLRKMYIVKDQEEFKRFLRAAGVADNEIAFLVGNGIGGTGARAPGEYVSTCSPGADADDSVSHRVGHALLDGTRSMAVPDVGNPSPELEDWLQESVAYDLTRRLLGTNATRCVAFGKYGQDQSPRPGEDLWIMLARLQVELDDDIPLSRLIRCKLQNQDLRGPETVKGYAFLQYLFETDAEKACKFIWYSSAQGTPAACEAAFGQSMEELDAGYREWIMKTW